MSRAARRGGCRRRSLSRKDCAAQVTLSAAFFAAGVSKLRHAGLDWFLSDNLRLLLIERSYLTLGPGRFLLNLEVARYPLLCKALAAGTLLIELSYPLALAGARARAVLVPASLLMLAGIALLMGPKFYSFVLLSLFWVPWHRVTSRLR